MKKSLKYIIYLLSSILGIALTLGIYSLHKNNSASCLLIEAVKAHNKEQARDIIYNQAHCIDQFDNFNRTPLFYAVLRRNYDIVKMLLEKGANPYHEDREYYTPLILAVVRGEYEIVKLFIEAGVDFKKPNTQRLVPFNAAREYEVFDILNLFENILKLDTVFDNNYKAVVNNTDLKSLLDLYFIRLINQQRYSQAFTLYEKYNSYFSIPLQSFILSLTEKGHLLLDSLINKHNAENSFDYSLLSSSSYVVKDYASLLKAWSYRSIKFSTFIDLLKEYKSNRDLLEKIITVNKSIMNTCDQERLSPLLYVLNENNNELLRILLAYGANPYITCCFQAADPDSTPLVNVILSDNIDSFKEFVRAGTLFDYRFYNKQSLKDILGFADSPRIFALINNLNQLEELYQSNPDKVNKSITLNNLIELFFVRLINQKRYADALIVSNLYGNHLSKPYSKIGEFIKIYLENELNPDVVHNLMRGKKASPVGSQPLELEVLSIAQHENIITLYNLISQWISRTALLSQEFVPEIASLISAY